MEYQSFVIPAERPYGVFAYRSEDLLRIGVEVASLVTVSAGADGGPSVSCRSLFRDCRPVPRRNEGAVLFPAEEWERVEFVCRQGPADYHVLFRVFELEARYAEQVYDQRDIERMLSLAGVSVGLQDLPDNVDVLLFRDDAGVVRPYDMEDIIVVRPVPDDPPFFSLSLQVAEWEEFFEEMGHPVVFRLRPLAGRDERFLDLLIRRSESLSSLDDDGRQLLRGAVSFVAAAGGRRRISPAVVSRLFSGEGPFFGFFRSGSVNWPSQLDDAVRAGWFVRSCDGTLEVSDRLASFIDFND